MFNPSRDQVRRFFCGAWQKRQAGQVPLEKSEALAAEIAACHPEYHGMLADTEHALQREWTPDSGQANPFLHLSLHLALAEQLSIDQPFGIRTAYATLTAGREPHAAQHLAMEILAEALWHAERTQTPVDAAAYLEKMRRTARAKPGRKPVY